MAKSASITALAIAAVIAAAIGGSVASAQQHAPGDAATAAQHTPLGGDRTINPAAQNFFAEHEIGRRFHFDPNNLPPPKSGRL